MAEPEHAAELDAEEDQPEPGKTLEGLAALWEDDKYVRSLVLSTQSLLKWPSKKKMGVITFETMSANYRVLSLLLKIWLPLNESAKTVFIDHVRNEAWGWNHSVLIMKFCFWLGSLLKWF